MGFSVIVVYISWSCTWSFIGIQFCIVLKSNNWEIVSSRLETPVTIFGDRFAVEFWLPDNFLLRNSIVSSDNSTYLKKLSNINVSYPHFDYFCMCFHDSIVANFYFRNGAKMTSIPVACSRLRVGVREREFCLNDFES